jgi:hypothetical protein
MQLFTNIFERLPIVWFLLGLLFISAGLYLGFDYSLAFGYMMIGLFCCAYGLALFVFRLGAHPSKAAATRLSPTFISAGATVMMPAMPKVENKQPAEQSNAE